MGLILLFAAMAMSVAALPRWAYSRNWGYYPSGEIGVAVVLLFVLLLIGYIPRGF